MNELTISSLDEYNVWRWSATSRKKVAVSDLM